MKSSVTSSSQGSFKGSLQEFVESLRIPWKIFLSCETRPHVALQPGAVKSQHGAHELEAGA